MPGRRHLGEKVDAARAATAAAAVETHGVLGDAVHAEADRPPGKAGCEGGDNSPAPFGFIRQPIAIIAFDISVT